MNPLSYLFDNPAQVLGLARAHLWISCLATGIAAAVSIPLGILVHRVRAFRMPALGLVNVGQAIPSLALLGLMLPLLGIGFTPALVAITARAFLPILLNTYAGLLSIPHHVIEAARGMGMTKAQVLRRVELPLALPVIVAGIRTALVISIGVATLAAYIGAGGLGDLIFQGIAMVDTPLLLAGAIPAAVLAFGADGVFGILERQLVRPVG
ncbi:MAG TPA: ABC transporter permease [Candidatus Acidoferrum sp.]|nr:ABC transporter permease [Candidatus Acidoferrum sp.]